MTTIFRVFNVLVPVFIGIVGQLFLKYGMNKVGSFGQLPILEYFWKAFTTLPVLLGFFFYFVSALFWMIVLSKEEISFAYPLLSLGYVIVILASIFLFREQVSLIRWLGVLVIILGVILISRS